MIGSVSNNFINLKMRYEVVNINLKVRFEASKMFPFDLLPCRGEESCKSCGFE